MTKTAKESLSPLDSRSRQLRQLVIKALEGGGRGHLGSSLSLIEMVRVLYDDVMSHRPADPRWEGRDRFILSKGHGCLALYAILADKGYFPEAELTRFCRAGTYLGGHPEAGKVPGVEASTGALGHGLPIGVGMALGLRIKQSANRVFVAMGDGEINEGSVWEAAMCAGKHKLAHLTALVDYNKIQSYGFTTEVQPLEPLADKWRAFGFAVTEVDGHDVAALRQALAKPDAEGRPGVVICHTVKGRGIPFAENDPNWHHKSKIAPAEIAAMYAALETV
ncbi:putative transketolase N-terminal section [Candidatus Terasakiella magnetica]|nr:putative transketolase N-terminal section [Candidatus Terasakiella magnetica]